jgi:hypothetical protein
VNQQCTIDVKASSFQFDVRGAMNMNNEYIMFEFKKQSPPKIHGDDKSNRYLSATEIIACEFLFITTARL